jgi:uncharacterized protein YecE (DUF72 family)
VLHAQSKKPKVPPRPAAFSQHPQVRFIGHPELQANETFLTPWVDKVAGWIEEGRSPTSSCTHRTTAWQPPWLSAFTSG